jgi:hypothetical protein
MEASQDSDPNHAESGGACVWVKTARQENPINVDSNRYLIETHPALLGL